MRFCTHGSYDPRVGRQTPRTGTKETNAIAHAVSFAHAARNETTDIWAQIRARPGNRRCEVLMPMLEIPLRSLGQTVRLDPRKPRRGITLEAWQRSFRQIEYWHRTGAHQRLLLHLVMANALTLHAAARAELRHQQPDRWSDFSEVCRHERELEALLCSRPHELYATQEQLDSMPAIVKKQRRHGPLVIVLPSERTITLRAAEPPEGVESRVWRGALRKIAWEHRHDSYTMFFEMVVRRALTPEEGAHELVLHQRQRGLETRDFASFVEELRYLRNQPPPPPRPPRPLSIWQHLDRASLL